MDLCPPWENLDRLANAKLSDPDRQKIELHVHDCANCQQTLRMLTGGQTVVGQHAPLTSPSNLADLPPELQDHPRYHVTGLLGVGGMGAVYKADHRLLDRAVVLKIILQDYTNDQEMVERFRREARLAARLAHPNIVTLYEAEKVGPTHVMVMEYVDGTDLDHLLQRRGPLPIADACELIRQAALGLQHAHEQGMVHRDIKPSNLLLNQNGQVKLLDMGLAVLKSEKPGGSRLTAVTQVLGTLDYMAPEQWQDSHAVDIRADIYSLGCTLYELLTGKPPFPGETYPAPMNQMWAHSNKPHSPIHEVRPDVPAELVDVIDGMLAKKPTNRIQTPAEVAAALAPFTAGADLHALMGKPSAPRTHVGTVTWVSPRRRRSFWPLVAAGLAVLLLAAGGVIFWLTRGHTHDTGPAPITFTGPPIKVGILHSRTGTMSISEKPVSDATLFAIDEINQKGGLLGRKVEGVLRDGGSEERVFARMAEELIDQEKVVTLFGCWTSSSRKAVKPIVEKNDHLLIYPVQYEGLEMSPNIVYLGAAPNQQIVPAIRWFCKTLGKKNLYLVGSDYVYPRAASAVIHDEIKELDAKIIDEDYLLLGNTEVDPVVKKIKAAKPDLIVNLINGDANVAFFRELRAAGVKTPILSFSITENVLDSLNVKDITGDYAAWNYFQSIDLPQNKEFVSKFQSRYPGAVTTDPMEAAYVGVHMWAQAVQKAGSDDVKAIRQAMKDQSFDAPEGPVRIDPETQHTWKTFRIGQITSDRRFEVIYRSDQSIRPIPYHDSRTREQWDKFLDEWYQRWGGNWANPGK